MVMVSKHGQTCRSKERMPGADRDFVECALEPALKSVAQSARDRIYLYF